MQPTNNLGSLFRDRYRWTVDLENPSDTESDTGLEDSLASLRYPDFQDPYEFLKEYICLYAPGLLSAGLMTSTYKYAEKCWLQPQSVGSSLLYGQLATVPDAGAAVLASFSGLFLGTMVHRCAGVQPLTPQFSRMYGIFVGYIAGKVTGATYPFASSCYHERFPSLVDPSDHEVYDLSKKLLIQDGSEANVYSAHYMLVAIFTGMAACFGLLGFQLGQSAYQRGPEIGRRWWRGEL